MKTFLKWGGIAVIGATAILNMQPILEVVAQVAGTITEIPFGWLFKLLHLGWLLWFLGRMLETIVGIAVWLLIQVMELLPSVINDDVYFLKILITGFSRFTEEAIQSGDSELVRDLKQRYNESPKRWMAAAQGMRAAAYIFEFLLACYRFPPYQGGYQAFAKDLSSLSPAMVSNFSLQQLLMIVITMFAFEGIVGVLSWLATGGLSFGLASDSSASRNAPGGYSTSREGSKTQRPMV